MKATLSVDIGASEPMVADFDITKPEDAVTIILTPTDVKIHTASEPKVSTT